MIPARRVSVHQKGPKRVDIAIVGGGIVGASIAWALASRNTGSIALFEKSTIAAEASGKTGALLRRHYSNEPEAKLAQMGYTMYRDWSSTVGGDCGFVPEGLVVTVDCSPEHAENIARLHTNVAMQNALGIDSRVITGDELKSMQPFMFTGDIPFASYEPESGYVNSIAATRGMATAAKHLGVDIREGVRVTAVATKAGRVTGIQTDDGPVAADVVIAANGPWSTKLLKSADVDIPISALRVQIAIVQRPLELDSGHFVLIDTAAGIFTRPWGPGASLVGVGGGDQHDEVDPDSYEPGNDRSYPALAIEAIAKRIPAMKKASYLHGHAGLYDMTPDAHPIIGSTQLEGLYIAAGFSGAGFKKGSAVGLCMAATICGDSPPVDISPFALSRFDTDTWTKPWSDSEYTFSSDFGHKF